MSAAPSRWSVFLERVRGAPIERDLRAWEQWLPEIRRRQRELGLVDVTTLSAHVRLLRDGASDAELPPPAARVEALAAVAEVARRVVSLDPHDAQLLAAMALCDRKLVEMATGEGKTLVAVFPAVLTAFAGQRTHVLTFNDYLARRDAAWMGPIYDTFGITVGVIQDASTPAERRAAYACDVTYATAKQVGFDRLRDGVALTPDARVLGALDAAIVDEADALLIDEARVPLVLAGAHEAAPTDVHALAALVASLAPGTDFEVDGLARNVTFTDDGLTRAEAVLGCEDLHAPGHEEQLAALHAALHARTLLQRDHDYLVRDGRIEIIDENTGRVVKDRKWPEGLHAALEAKEGVAVRAPGSILATTSVKELLTSYRALSGMTATAQPAAEELHEVYGLHTVVIPPNVPCIRVDAPDRVYATREAKDRAVSDEIRRIHATGQPILVGTRTVEESELLGAALVAEGLSVQVLNARHDEREAEVVAEAGALGALTIATNMAGRGTDICLGGADGRDHAQVASLGGLHVIGTNRHDSRRIDDQLRGRAGRQGDPGSSQFFVSLQDDLAIRVGAAETIPKSAQSPGADDRIDSPVLVRWLDHLQRVVDGQSAAMRKGALAYGAVLEHQGQLVQDLRDDVIAGTAILPRELARASVPAEVVGRLVLLAVDHLWSQHVSFAFALRETVVLERLAGREPRVEYDRRLGGAFADFLPSVRRQVAAELDTLTSRDQPISLEDPRLRGPSSTWTYLVDDDPFGDRFASALAGSPALGAAAALMWPLLLLWGITRHLQRRRRTH